MKGYSMRLDSRRVRAEKRKKEQENLELDLRQKTSRVNMLEDMEKNMEGYTGSVRAVMREAKRGSLRGSPRRAFPVDLRAGAVCRCY